MPDEYKPWGGEPATTPVPPPSPRLRRRGILLALGAAGVGAASLVPGRWQAFSPGWDGGGGTQGVSAAPRPQGQPASAPLSPSPPLRRPGGDGLPGWHAAWQSWSGRFLRGDGRVVDSGNGGVSHSEGQSYGLLFAEASGDRAAFDRIHRWTTTNLVRSGDTLMPWRYRPGMSDPVDDPNNASDGDLVFAWALARGAARWKDSTLQENSAAMGSDIVRLLVRNAGGRAVLLPGSQGFVKARGTTVNPSYYSYAAMRDLARLAPMDGRWGQLETDGVEMTGSALFGQWQLPPDWIWIPDSGTLTWSPDMPPRFSYDAIRVPIHLVWSGNAAHPAVRAAADFLSHGHGAAWTDLRTGAASPEGQSAGHRAVALLSTAASSGRMGGIRFGDVGEAGDYYAASLNMLCRLAAAESTLS
jgi:endo-1,4-beta-D-glucanase Y